MAEQVQWLTLRQVRELLTEMGVTDQTIRNWGDSGKLDTRRTAGRQRRFSSSSVERVLAEWRGETPAVD